MSRPRNWKTLSNTMGGTRSGWLPSLYQALGLVKGWHKRTSPDPGRPAVLRPNPIVSRGTSQNRPKEDITWQKVTVVPASTPRRRLWSSGHCSPPLAAAGDRSGSARLEVVRGAGHRFRLSRGSGPQRSACCGQGRDLSAYAPVAAASQGKLPANFPFVIDQRFIETLSQLGSTTLRPTRFSPGRHPGRRRRGASAPSTSRRTHCCHCPSVESPSQGPRPPACRSRT